MTFGVSKTSSGMSETILGIPWVASGTPATGSEMSEMVYGIPWMTCGRSGLGSGRPGGAFGTPEMSFEIPRIGLETPEVCWGGSRLDQETPVLVQAAARGFAIRSARRRATRVEKVPGSAVRPRAADCKSALRASFAGQAQAQLRSSGSSRRRGRAGGGEVLLALAQGCRHDGRLGPSPATNTNYG